MLRRITAIGLAISVLLLALASLPMQRVFALTATVTSTPCGAGLTITGKIVNASNGMAIAGATVIADTSVSHPFSTTTAADGTYTLSIPAASNYACLVNGLRVSAAGYDEASRVISAATLRTQPVQNFSLTAGSAVITSTRTPAPGCGTRVVVTSTPSPTFTATPRVATGTVTATCSPIYITATPGGSVNLPDLTVLSITEYGYTVATPTPDALGCWRPNAGSNIGLRVTVQNNGTVAAGAFVVDLNGSQQSVGGLAAGQSMAVDFTYTGQTLSRSRVATADATGVIAESDETNNVYSLILSAATSTRTGTARPQICNTRTHTPPAPTLTPTITPSFTPACMMTTVPMIVATVTSPTSALTQVINVTLPGGSSVTITSQAGTFTSTTRVGNVFSVTIDLVANATNNLTIVGTIPATGGCAGYSMTATATIVHTVGIITRTPTISPTPIGNIGYRYIGGYVTDASTGAAIAGATVTCSHTSPVSTGPKCIGTTTTSATGSYSFGNIYFHDTDSMTISVQATGYIAKSVVRSGLSFLSGSANINFALVTNTVITATPTVSPTPTNPGGFACNPLTATISVPFTKDGAGTFCWQASALGTYINSWNLTSLQINGVNFTNAWAPISSLPAKAGGYWYIRYNGAYAWSHFEAK